MLSNNEKEVFNDYFYYIKNLRGVYNGKSM